MYQKACMEIDFIRRKFKYLSDVSEYEAKKSRRKNISNDCQSYAKASSVLLEKHNIRDQKIHVALPYQSFTINTIVDKVLIISGRL